MYKCFLVPQLFLFSFPFANSFVFVFFFSTWRFFRRYQNKTKETSNQTNYIFFLADQKEIKIKLFLPVVKVLDQEPHPETCQKKMNSPVPFDLCDADWRTWRKIFTDDNWGKKFARQCFFQAKVLKLLLLNGFFRRKCKVPHPLGSCEQ